MKKSSLLLVFLVAVIFSGSAFAQDPIIFPAEGQSEEQMEKDKFSCYQWAKNETGFDPMKVPTASTPPPQQQAKGGGAGRGAVVGAGAGALSQRDIRLGECGKYRMQISEYGRLKDTQ